jgi:hypothetical protein
VIPRPEPNGGAAVHGIQRRSDEQKGTSSSRYPSSPRRTAPRSDELDGGPEPTCSTMAQRAVTCRGERHPARGSGSIVGGVQVWRARGTQVRCLRSEPMGARGLASVR